VERDLERGEYGKLLNSIEKKFVCSVCRKTFDTDGEVMEHFVDEHELSDLD